MIEFVTGSLILNYNGFKNSESGPIWQIHHNTYFLK
jgi:hypothetical protein